MGSRSKHSRGYWMWEIVDGVFIMRRVFNKGWRHSRPKDRLDPLFRPPRKLLLEDRCGKHRRYRRIRRKK